MFSAALFPVLLSSSSSRSDLRTSLVAHWKLDETSGVRADSKGNYPLTDNNEVGFAAGVIGFSANFDLDSYLSSEPIALTGRTGSLAFWVRAENPLTGGFPGYVLAPSFGGPEQGLSGYGISGFIPADGGGHPAGCPAMDINFIEGFVRLQSEVVVDDGDWHHVVATSDGTNAKLYLDGNLEVTEVLPDGSFTGGPLFLRAHPEWITYSSIEFDEVGIWSRGLTPAEATALYNGGAGLAYEAFGG